LPDRVLPSGLLRFDPKRHNALVMLSFPHLIVLFVVALIIFGPQKLPELARMLGKATAEFRKMTNDFRYALEDEVREMERQTRIKEEEAAAVKRAAEAPPLSPSPAPAPEPEGSVPRAIPETTVTATVEPPSEAGPAPTAESATSQAPAEAVTVPQEKPADDHAA
jgi:sec-independent protein translocase protein TatB